MFSLHGHLKVNAGPHGWFYITLLTFSLSDISKPPVTIICASNMLAVLVDILVGCTAADGTSVRSSASLTLAEKNESSYIWLTCSVSSPIGL